MIEDEHGVNKICWGTWEKYGPTLKFLLDWHHRWQ